jgi:hypothetical protein
VAAFEARLKDAVNLDSATDDLASVVGEALEPAHVAVDGGIGTLTEAALAWSILQTEPVGAELIT